VALTDHKIAKHAEIRRSKLGLDTQEVLVDDFTYVGLQPVTTEMRHWSIIEDDRTEAGPPAAGAGTLAQLDGQSSVSLQTHATEGEFIRIESGQLLQQGAKSPRDSRTLGIEIEARLNIGTGAVDMTDSRVEFGMYQDLNAGTSRNSPVTYACLSRDTQRSSDNWWLVAAGSDYRAMSIDASLAPAAELIDQTADAQNLAANDVPVGSNGATDITVNDGLLITNPRHFKAAVLTVGTAEVRDHTYLWEYWNGTAWVLFVPSQGAFLGSVVGRQIIEVPTAAYDLMGVLGATSQVGTAAATVANAPGASIIGHFAIRCRISVVGGGAGPRGSAVNWISVEEVADTLVAPTDAVNQRLRITVSAGTNPSVGASIDTEPFVYVNRGALPAGQTRQYRITTKLQTLAGEAKRVDIDYIKASQDRP
jgi:hypothetical protein